MKRKTTILGTAIVIIVVITLIRLSIVKNVFWSIFLIIIGIVLVVSSIQDLKLIHKTRKYYKKLLNDLKYLEFIQRMRYKELLEHRRNLFNKEILEEYDKDIEKTYTRINDYVNYLKNRKDYLSKKRYKKVLEIANEVLKPDRA